MQKKARLRRSGKNEVGKMEWGEKGSLTGLRRCKQIGDKARGALGVLSDANTEGEGGGILAPAANRRGAMTTYKEKTRRRHAGNRKNHCNCTN